MRDYLIRVSTPAQAKIALARYVNNSGERDGFKLPKWCDYLEVDAYTNMGTPPVMDNSASSPRVLVPGVPPTKATGKWFIVSLDKGEQLPQSARASVQAEVDRDRTFKLPDGVVGLSTIWAGMKLAT